MIPYFLLIGLPILAWGISSKYRFTLNRRVLFETNALPMDLFMLSFLCLLALRGLKCGSDTVQYARHFEEYGQMSYSWIIRMYDQERGFKLLAKLVYDLGGSYQVFLGVTACLCVVPIWYLYRRESDHQLLTMAIFLAVAPFSMYFSGIRQAIAMSVGLLAWYAARDKKRILFLLCVAVAMSFHTSAFILLAIYPLYSARITQKWLLVVIPVMLGVFMFRTPIFNFLLRFLWEEYETTPETGATTTLILLILFTVYAYLIVDDERLERDVIALRNILLLSIIIQVFAMLHPLSMRMNYYFLLYVPILVPRIAARSQKRYQQVAKLSVIVMTAYFMFYFVSKIVKDIDSLNIFPYTFFWQG